MLLAISNIPVYAQTYNGPTDLWKVLKEYRVATKVTNIIMETYDGVPTHTPK